MFIRDQTGKAWAIVQQNGKKANAFYMTAGWESELIQVVQIDKELDDLAELVDLCGRVRKICQTENFRFLHNQ